MLEADLGLFSHEQIGISGPGSSYAQGGFAELSVHHNDMLRNNSSGTLNFLPFHQLEERERDSHQKHINDDAQTRLESSTLDADLDNGVCEQDDQQFCVDFLEGDDERDRVGLHTQDLLQGLH
jgi:hypothetical protein